MNKNVNYGNWVPEKMLALCYVAAAVLGIAAYVTGDRKSTRLNSSHAR